MFTAVVGMHAVKQFPVLFLGVDSGMNGSTDDDSPYIPWHSSGKTIMSS